MYRLFTSMVLLVLLQVGFNTHLNGQGCNLKTGVLALACTAGASLSYEDGIDCYTEIRMLLDAGTFYEWTANATDGWIVEQLAPNELLVTHMNGTFPSGDHTMVNFLYYTPGGVPTQLILLYPDLCVMEGCENQHTLPGCGEVQVSGTVYRECDMQPLTNQCGWPDAVVELWDEFGLLLDEQVTDENGNYSFQDLSPGTYVLRLMQMSPKHDNIPPNGDHIIELLPGASEVRDFGVCPECSCADFDILLQQEPGNGDTSYLYLSAAVNSPFCLERYEITIDSGNIVGFDLLSDGWVGEIINGQLAELYQQTMTECSSVPYVKLRARIAIDFGIKEKGIKATVQLIGDGNQPPEPMCVDSILFEHPSKYKEFTCCPDGTIQGPELVQNGQFFIITPPTTDYNYKTTPSVPGDIAILSQANAYATNNAWVCGAVGGPLDHYLVADGSATGGLSVWKQQVTGLIADDSYVFCALFNNLVKPALDYDDPIVELVIEDDFNTSNSWSSGPLTLPEVPDNWEQLTLNWTVPFPTAASYTLKIISQGTSSVGNDFAVDEIGFKTCKAVQDSCCKDLQAFCDDLEAGIVFSADSCKITMDLSALPPC